MIMLTTIIIIIIIVVFSIQFYKRIIFPHFFLKKMQKKYGQENILTFFFPIFGRQKYYKESLEKYGDAL